VPERVTIGIGIVVLLAALGTLLISPYVARKAQLVHRGDGVPTFNLVYPAKVVHRVAPHPGELARLEAHRQRVSATITASPLHLPAYPGIVSFGLLPVYSHTYAERLRSQYPGFELRDEGKVRINEAPGYQIGFRAGRAGHFTWGRDILFIPRDDKVRDGVVVRLRLIDVGKPTKREQRLIDTFRGVLRSFSFGTDRA
jgi:hypothetical protein